MFAGNTGSHGLYWHVVPGSPGVPPASMHASTVRSLHSPSMQQATVSHASPTRSPSKSDWSGFGTLGQLSRQSRTPSPSVSTSGTPQPHTPGDVLFGSSGQLSDGGGGGGGSMQSGTPSLSLSVSGSPQPQAPGDVLSGSFGHWSTQSATPSPSESVSGWPQPHWPGDVLAGSSGQKSLGSIRMYVR